MKKILASLIASAFLLGAPAIAATTAKKPAVHAVKHAAVAKKAAHVKQKTSAKAKTKAKAKAKPAKAKTAPKTAPKSK